MTLFKPESEVFEITDFTNATDWESFTTKLENVLYFLGVGSKRLDESRVDASPESAVSSHTIVLRERTFCVSLIVASGNTVRSKPFTDVQHALSDYNDDYPERSHCLTYWFGLQKFIILSPSGDKSFSVSDTSLANQLLSSLTIAAGQAQCHIPLFVQVHQISRNMYDGVWLSGDGIRTNFSVLTLPNVPNQYNYLSGLGELFHGEMGVYKNVQSPFASLRFTYLLREWPENVLHREVANLCSLPVGGGGDCLSSLQLSVRWRKIRVDEAFDTAHHRSLHPSSAGWWTLRAIRYDTPTANSNSSSSAARTSQNELAQLMAALLHLCQREERLNHLLGRHAFQEDEPSAELQQNVRSALHRMTSPAMRAPTLSSLVQSAVVSSALEDSPLEDVVIDEMMHAVFPDMTNNSSSNNSQVNDERPVEEDSEVDVAPPENSIDAAPSRVLFKSCPSDSLLVRIACTLLRVHFECGGIRSLAYVWREFVLELRHRYEHAIPLVDIPRAAVPDMRYSLLQQKLQMLQCCIEHKRKVSEQKQQPQQQHQSEASGASASEVEATPAAQEPEGWGDADLDMGSQSDSDSDEFYEAVEEQESAAATRTAAVEAANQSTAAVDEATAAAAVYMGTSAPEGVLSVGDELHLLVSGAPLNIPITQDVTPMTEDMLAEQQAMLAGFGTSDVARQLRARIQSTQLLADMEAFKAANPGCILGDFVRWYSPRDWVVDSTPMTSNDTASSSTASDAADGEWDIVSEGDVLQASTTAEDAQTGTDDADDSAAIGGNSTEQSRSCHSSPGGFQSDGERDDADAHCTDNAVASDNTVLYTAPGHLSVRMCDPSSLWHQTWTSARSVPAHRQRRLFDDTLEAERVFRFLEEMTVGQLMLHVAPVIVCHAIDGVDSLAEADYSAVGHLLDMARDSLARVFTASVEFLPQLSDAVLHLADAESKAMCAHSLRLALEWGYAQYSACHDDTALPLNVSQLKLWIDDLLSGMSVVMMIRPRRPYLPPLECALRGLLTSQAHSERRAATSLGAAAEPEESMKYTVFPAATAREFILRDTHPLPGVRSRPTAHRLFAAITPKEFRLASAFSTDMTYL
eukprot:scpid22138/ scgid24323/ Rab3 GTPase-activating protein catalytic subunit; RAB3 GTPase-activating protein 130 kDa subunit; Rab3-GAP p130